MVFRVKWGQKSPKSKKMRLAKMYLDPCKGAAGRSSISGGNATVVDMKFTNKIG